MSKQLRLQVRGPNNKTARLALDPTITYEALVEQVVGSFPGLSNFILHVGVPPKIQEIDASMPSTPIVNLGVRNGDTIIVELGGSGGMVQGTGWDLPPTIDPRGNVGRMIHYKVPGDNSCMFHSVGAALMRKNPSAQMVKELKQVIIEQIKANPKEWTIAELGESPSSYIAQLQQPSFWGGAIELAILSAKYECEIAVVDFSQLCITTFAHYPEDGDPNKRYKRRIYLMYNAKDLRTAHYDLVVYTIDAARASSLSGMSAGQAESDSISDFSTSLQSIFRPGDEAALLQIKKLAELQHSRLVQEGQATKRTWTEKDMIKNKNKPQFTGGTGTLGETANITNHQDYAKPAPNTTPTATAPAVKPAETSPVTDSTSKPAPKPVASPISAPISKVDWNCSVCTYVNTYARSRCEMCDSPKPAVSAAPAAVKPATTSAPSKPAVSVAPAAVKPTTTPAPTKPAVTTTATTATTTAPKPTAATATVANRPWTCGSCTYSNRGSSTHCEMCSADRPSAGGAAAPSTRTVKAAEPAPSSQTNDAETWQCQQCNTTNPKDKNKCGACGQKQQDCNIM